MMKKAYIFLATGYEEVEALTVVDLLRRGGVDCKIVSIMPEREVTSSHHVTITADLLFDEQNLDDADMLIMPGGIPGTPNLKAHEGLNALICKYQSEGKYLAAVCAAPTIYGEMGLLKGKKATCYPGMEEGLVGAECLTDKVVCDGQFITSRGMGTCIDFGLTLLAKLEGKEVADNIAEKIVY